MSLFSFRKVGNVTFVGLRGYRMIVSYLKHYDLCHEVLDVIWIRIHDVSSNCFAFSKTKDSIHIFFSSQHSDR